MSPPSASSSLRLGQDEEGSHSQLLPLLPLAVVPRERLSLPEQVVRP